MPQLLDASAFLTAPAKGEDENKYRTVNQSPADSTGSALKRAATTFKRLQKIGAERRKAVGEY